MKYFTTRTWIQYLTIVLVLDKCTCTWSLYLECITWQLLFIYLSWGDCNRSVGSFCVHFLLSFVFQFIGQFITCRQIASWTILIHSDTGSDTDSDRRQWYRLIQSDKDWYRVITRLSDASDTELVLCIFFKYKMEYPTFSCGIF